MITFLAWENSRLVEANFQPVISTTQIWVVMRHQYGISGLDSQTSFRGETTETSFGVAKCRLFSQPLTIQDLNWKGTYAHVQNANSAVKVLLVSSFD